MANVYGRGKLILTLSSSVWSDGTSDVQGILVDSAYTYDVSHNFLSEVTGGAGSGDGGELSNSNYVRQSILNRTTVENGSDIVVLDAADITFSSLAAGQTPDAVILFHSQANQETDNDSTLRVISYHTLSSPPVPNGGDYTIVWDSNGILQFRDS